MCEDSDHSIDHSVGFQEENEQVKLSAWKASCVVIAEHWPSWSFALHSLGVQDLETVLSVASAGMVKEVMETALGSTLIGKSKDVLEQAAVDGRWRKKLIFIQGSEFFITNVKGLLKDSNEAGTFGIVPDEGRRQKTEEPVTCWKEKSPLLVKRSQTGGITRSRWNVYSDQKLTGLKSSHVKQVLAHILVSTESGVEVIGNPQCQEKICPK